MADPPKEQVTLQGKHVWIIDDDIPIHLAKFKDDDLISGKRPVDRGTLRALIASEDWVEDPLKALCRELVEHAGNVTAFPQPSAAIAYLESGAQVPDVIVYDLGYRNLAAGTDADDLLRRILERCVSVVQIYTEKQAEKLSPELERLRKRYTGRLGQPQNKAATDAAALTRLLAEQSQKSLSARLASTVRLSSSRAIEQVLVRIDDLPIEVAVRLLTGDQAPEEVELVELLSTKVAEALGSHQELREAVGQYARDKGVAAERVDTMVDEIVALVVAHTREGIQGGGLYDVVQSAWSLPKQDGAKPNAAPYGEIVREFFAFRVYSQPRDKVVRTGDVIVRNGCDLAIGKPPELFLVLSPPCDLARFYKKTRGVLTAARMCALDSAGIGKVFSYGNRDFKGIKSITNLSPMVMASVPIAEGPGGRMDYALDAHELQQMELPNDDLVNAGAKVEGLNKPLLYGDVGFQFQRVCHVSEPFLSGILAKIHDTLFRIGVPDYPEVEYERLDGLFNDKKKGA